MNFFHQEFLYQIEKIKDKIIIVEGKKDKDALASFGINDVIQLSKKPIFQIVEETAIIKKECVILTDLDKKGKELYGKLSSGLQQFGVKIDNNFRTFLFKNTKLRQIEGISGFMKKIKSISDEN